MKNKKGHVTVERLAVFKNRCSLPSPSPHYPWTPICSSVLHALRSVRRGDVCSMMFELTCYRMRKYPGSLQPLLSTPADRKHRPTGLRAGYTPIRMSMHRSAKDASSSKHEPLHHGMPAPRVSPSSSPRLQQREHTEFDISPAADSPVLSCSLRHHCGWSTMAFDVEEPGGAADQRSEASRIGPR